MQIEILKSKIHRAVVTQADLNYVGSIAIDQDLIEAANLIENEKVHIYNITNGERFETYVIQGARGSGIISLNGAAARKVQLGDLVIIVSYASIDFEEAKSFKPAIIFPDNNNKLQQVSKKNIFSVLKILFFLAIGVFFIWIFLRKLTPVQKQEIWQSFGYANYYWVALSIVIGILSHVVRAIRWKSLIEPMGYTPGNVNTFLAVMIGYLANMALPRLGEVTRCGVLNKYEKIPMNKSIGTVIVERSIDMLVFIILFFVNLFLFFNKLGRYVEEKVYGPLSEKLNISEETSLLLWLLLAAFIILIGVFIIFRHKISHLKIYQKARELLVGFWHGLGAFTKIKNPITFIFQSLLIWVLYFLMVYVCFFSLPETSHLGVGAGLSVLIFGSIGIMIVQGGIGIYPAIVAETLVLYQIANTTGYAIGWITWSAQTLMIVIAGTASLILLPIINKKPHAKA